MKRLFATTSILAALSAPAFADNHEMSEDAKNEMRMQNIEAMKSMEIDASELFDTHVYMKTGAKGDMATDDLAGNGTQPATATEDAAATDVADAEAGNMGEGFAEVPDNWEMVGEIEDIVLTADGEVNSLIIDAGGFLGMGETEKQVDLANISFVPDSDDEDEFYVVYTGSRAKFEEARQYDATQAGETELQRHRESAEVQQQLDAREVQEVELAQLSTEELLGAAAYGANDNWVGEVSELELAEDGKIEAVIVDVGGFLGLGEKPVAVSLDKVELTRMEGDEIRAYLSATEEELEGMESWTSEEM